jgi:hypothetical protein
LRRDTAQPRQQPAQRGAAAEEPGQHVRIAARAALHRSVGIEDARARHGALRLPRSSSSSAASAPGCSRHRVHDEHERRAGPRQRLVHGPAEADVGGVGDERHGGRELLRDGALPSCDALSTTTPSQARPPLARNRRQRGAQFGRRR